MKIVFGGQAWRDYVAWAADDPKILARINALIEEYREETEELETAEEIIYEDADQ